MGNKFSTIGSAVLRGVGAVARAVPDVVSGSLEGASAGSLGGPVTGLLGGLAGGLTRGISHVSDVVNAVKGNSQSVPFSPEHLANVLSDGMSAVKSASALKQLLPQAHQDKLATVLASASQGKIAKNIVQTGKFAQATADHVLGQVYKGTVKPDKAESLFSPTFHQANTMITPQQQKDLKGERSVAYMANLNPTAVPVPA